MDWHAIDGLGRAYEATRALLLPFSLNNWIVLGIVVFFIGWTSGISGSWNVPSGVVTIPDATWAPGVTQPEWRQLEVELSRLLAPLFAAMLVGTVVAVGLIATVIASIMQFVFVRQLTEREIRIRGYFGESVGPGIRLLLLWIGLGLLLVAVAFAMLLLTIITFGLFVLVLIALIPILFLAGIAMWVFVRFTIDFVVPIMLVDEAGVIEAWKRLATEIRVEWKQYGLYAVARFFLDLVAGLLLAIGTTIAFVIIAIPAILVGLLVYGIASLVSSTVAAVATAALVGMVLLLAAAIATVFVGVPVHTYLRYYALFVLARTSPEYDMLEAVRGAIGEPTG